MRGGWSCGRANVSTPLLYSAASPPRPCHEARRLAHQPLRPQDPRAPRGARSPTSSSRRTPGPRTPRVPRYNPLNKVPALQLDDGECLYDSQVIAEYLDALSGGDTSFPPDAARARARAPRRGAGRRHRRCRHHARSSSASARRRARTGVDRAPARQGERGHRRAGEVARGEVRTSARDRMNLGDIACGCALFWLEFRMPELRWRDDPRCCARGRERLESARLRSPTTPPAGLADHASAEAHLAAVEHRRLPGRHGPLRRGEVELEAPPSSAPRSAHAASAWR